jgi:hypothetical protein
VFEASPRSIQTASRKRVITGSGDSGTADTAVAVACLFKMAPTSEVRVYS